MEFVLESFEHNSLDSVLLPVYLNMPLLLLLAVHPPWSVLPFCNYRACVTKLTQHFERFYFILKVFALERH